MQHNAQTFWSKKSIFSLLLLPLSWLFYLIISVRKYLYQYGVFQVEKSTLPVVCIGNINVGGTGKTPLVIAIANDLIQSGLKVGIISKGYGGLYRKQSCVHLVTAVDTAEMVGDEVILIRDRLQVPMIVADKKAFAAKLMPTFFPEVDVILSDDGLQHYALHKHIEIAVIPSKYRFGNGLLLPAGPLREPISRLKDADFIVENTGTSASANFSFANTPVYHYTLAPIHFKNVLTQAVISITDMAQLTEEAPALALAGIAHPDAFFESLHTLGVKVKNTAAFPDHHAFKTDDLQANRLTLITEKDAVKISALGLDQTQYNLWALVCDARLSKGFSEALIHKLKAHISTKD